jgi:integrase
VPRNVAALARPPRQEGRIFEYLTRDELRRLLDVCEGQPAGPLVILAATTGLRQGELIGLAWSAVDVHARTLTSGSRWRARGTASRWPSRRRRGAAGLSTFPEPALRALEARRTAQDAEREAAGDDWADRDGLVFTDALGRPVKARDANTAFHALLEQAGLRSVPFHAMRHSWAALARASGVPLKVIADNLGHASITVTAAFYSGIVPELDRDAADAIGRALS